MRLATGEGSFVSGNLPFDVYAIGPSRSAESVETVEKTIASNPATHLSNQWSYQF
jgi:hypothetical protein